jgi:hypothetical protein
MYTKICNVIGWGIWKLKKLDFYMKTLKGSRPQENHYIYIK